MGLMAKGSNPEMIVLAGGGVLLLGVFLSKGSSGGTKTTVVQPSAAALNAASANYATSLNNQLQSKSLDYQHQENVLNIGVKREANQMDSANTSKAIDASAAATNQQYQLNQQQLANQGQNDFFKFIGNVAGSIIGLFL